jgi:hypothetical protein
MNSTFQDGVVFLTCDLIATNNKMLCNEILWHVFKYCLKGGKDTKFQQGLSYTSYVQQCNFRKMQKKLVKQNLFIILDDVQNLKVIKQLQFCDKGVKYSMKSFDAWNGFRVDISLWFMNKCYMLVMVVG